MLLTGTNPRTLDEKNRVVLPKRVREQMGEPPLLFVTPGPDRCLWLFTQDSLERLAEKLDQAPATDAEGRTFRRLYFAQAESVDVDKAGRILIPERLLAFAGLEKEAVLIGVRDHLELWEAGHWQQYLQEHSPRFDTVAESAFRK
jgi:MraZ protein